MKRTLDPLALLLLVLTGIMGLLALLVFSLVIADPWATRRPASNTSQDDPRPTCDLSRPEGPPCPAGSLCLSGRCEPLEEERFCAQGESCRDCECDLGLVCHQLRCFPKDKLTLAPLDCRTPAVAQAINKLLLSCSSRDKSFAELKSLGGCSGADWQAIAIGNDEFDLLLTAFDHRFSIHFPANEPRKRGSWPSPRERAFLLDQLRHLREPLKGAKKIFIIGRSSPDGQADANYALALQRIDMVTGLVEEVVHEGIPRTEQKPLSILQWAMRGERVIRPTFFQKHYVSTTLQTGLGASPMITSDEASQRWLTTMLAQPQRSEEDEQKLTNLLNRVVLVVPIPCDGSEYVPRDPLIPASRSPRAPALNAWELP